MYQWLSLLNPVLYYIVAGSVMYEYGMRLEQEVSGLRGLQKQAKCYLAALNALRQVNPDYAWIVKPVPSLEEVRNLLSTSILNGFKTFFFKSFFIVGERLDTMLVYFF